MAEAWDVRIFDTTLRDGEQAPGFSMRIDEKMRVARAIEALGADIIEAGFPIASAADAEAVRRIATEIRRPVDRRARPVRPDRHRVRRDRTRARRAVAHPHLPRDVGPAPRAQAAHDA